MYSQMTRLIRGLWCGLIAPGHFSTLVSANSDGLSKFARRKRAKPGERLAEERPAVAAGAKGFEADHGSVR